MASEKANQLSLKLKSHSISCFPSDSFSPITDLTHNLGSLSTISSTTDFISTPKRRISWSNIDTPSPDFKKDLSDNSDSSPTDHRSLSDISNEPKQFIRPRQPLKDHFTTLVQHSEALRNSPVKENLSSLGLDLEKPRIKETQILESLNKNSSRLINRQLVTPNSIIIESDEDGESNTDEISNARNCIRGLFQDSSESEKRNSNKRSECQGLTETPLLHEPKRRKAISLCSIKKRFLPMDSARSQKYNRCFSESEATNIMKAVQLSAENPDLIGDFTRPYILPLMMSKHQDLKSISPETMANLLKGGFMSQIKNHIVIDCRFPYEYEGGHIKGALNIYTREALQDEFFTQSKTDSKSKILIFHCEFSSERGPSMSRFLRNKDREANEYPKLHYPEIYLLNGGYKAFYEYCKELCEPQSYKPMIHEAHEDDLKYFRAKSKSMNPEQKKSKIFFRHGLKF